MIAPSGRVPEQGPDWFLLSTKAYGGGTPDLGSVLEVLGYKSIYGCRGYVGGATGAPRGRGWARPPPSWAARDSLGPTPILRGLLLVQR